MSIDRIVHLLGRCGGPERNFPPTGLYNEGWMLRLALDCLSQNPDIDSDLAFSADDRWYSETLLPSRFLSRGRGDGLAESWTYADGAVGNLEVGAHRQGNPSLSQGASRILVTEAKMLRKLSSGVKAAGYYHWAARNVACIAEVTCRAQMHPSEVTHIGYYVLAPKSQIRDGILTEYMTPERIRSPVGGRVSKYKDAEKHAWFQEWFIPTREKIRIREISWEQIVGLIKQVDSVHSAEMHLFYEKCLMLHGPVASHSALKQGSATKSGSAALHGGG